MSLASARGTYVPGHLFGNDQLQCSHSSLGGQVQHLVPLLDEMHREGQPRHVISFNSAISAC
eukprot:5053781-Karenia_brevis.AAC.1